MSITLSPMKWQEPLNVKDEVDYTFDLMGNLLEVGETPQSWALVLSPASIAAGLILGSGAYAAALSGTVLKFWFSIDPVRMADTSFDGIGTWLDMNLEVTTTNTPPRIRNRTLLLRVCRQ